MQTCIVLPKIVHLEATTSHWCGKCTNPVLIRSCISKTWNVPITAKEDINKFGAACFLPTLPIYTESSEITHTFTKVFSIALHIIRFFIIIITYYHHNKKDVLFHCHRPTMQINNVKHNTYILQKFYTFLNFFSVFGVIYKISQTTLKVIRLYILS